MKKKILILIYVFTSVTVFCQETETIQTLFNKDTKTGYSWSPGIKFNTIQGDPGALVELNGGILFNNTAMAGLAGGVNFGHPRVNYGYFGVIVQYIHKPNKLMHLSAQTIAGYGTTKDYEQEKSSLLDNFWNISGTSFYLIEPGLNLEVNLKENMRFTAGLSYRFVTGLDETSRHVSITNVTSQQMSGINLRAGLVFGKYR